MQIPAVNSAHSDRDPCGDFLVPTSNQSDNSCLGSATPPETRNFDTKLTEEVKNVPAVWNSRDVEEYKLAD